MFWPLTDDLLDRNPFLVCADLTGYAERQADVGTAYRDSQQWSRESILNIARCGCFSSDRAIRESNDDIWQAVPLPMALAK